MRGDPDRSAAPAVELIRELIAWPRGSERRLGARASWPGSSTPRARAAQIRCESRTPTRRSSSRSLTRLDHFGFEHTDRGSRPSERAAAASACAAGTVEQQRFFQPVDPAITRKRSLEGRAIKFAAGDLRVGVDRAARARDADVRHHDRAPATSSQRRRQPQLLRPPDARVPRPRTRGGTSSARSSSRSTCPRCCGRSWRGRRGRASGSRWARTPTRTSGSRAATSSCAGSGRRSATSATRARC